MSTPVTDWAALYAATLDALADLTAGQPESVASRVVPATPAWSVRQVLAHLAGTASDLTTGRMDGAPGQEWTARHVAERDAATIDDLLGELRATRPAVEAMAPEATAAVFNAVVHHADLIEALDSEQQADGLWSPVVEQLRGRWSRLPLRLDSDPIPDGPIPDDSDDYDDPAATVPVDGYQLSRALFSRLSRADVVALTGGRLTDEQIDSLGFFGPPSG